MRGKWKKRKCFEPTNIHKKNNGPAYWQDIINIPSNNVDSGPGGF